jgi:predicted negative regulator of RcsB-dependent stress response
MKRKKRKQLKEDEFVTVFNRAVHYIKKHTHQIYVLIILAVAAALIFLGGKFVSSRSQNKEGQVLAQIIDLQSGLKTQPENVANLEEIAGGGKFSRLAYIILATHFAESGDVVKARAYLEEFPKKRKDMLYYQAQDLLAQIYFQQKEFDRAIQIYREVEEENPGVYALDVILFHMAEAYEEKGETEEALALYRKIQEEYSNTYFGFDASQKVRKLEAKK